MIAPAAARRAAAVLVAEVLDHGRSLDDALSGARSFVALQGRDRAFARAIASTTLRRLGGVDQVLAHFLQKPLGDSAALARAILRTGAAQLLVLGSPAHAVVSESVSVARSGRSSAPFAGLINAVLRRVALEGAALFSELPAGSDLPEWLFARWRTTYGAAVAVRIAETLRSEAPLDLTVRTNPESWAQQLGGRVIGAQTVRLETPGDVTSLPGFSEGAWWVQDAAAVQPVQMLADVRGLRVLDLCAAPGGKTLQLAAGGAAVTALDLSEERLLRVRENLERLRLEARVIAADARTWAPEQANFDVVVLDAPCSATGTLRRHPDIAWLRRPTDISALASLQLSLLERAMTFTAPGGRILYAVCSLEPEEGEGVIAAALSRWPDRVATSGAPLRTTPADLADVGGMDGFFAQVLHRL